MSINVMNKRIRKILILIFWVIVWWILSMAVNNKILLASPWDTLRALGGMLCGGELYLTIAGSLLRIGAGFVLGFAAAVVLAVGSARYKWLEEVLEPFMNLIKTIPVASFVVLLLIWWGAPFLAVAISFLVVLPNIYINMLEGLKNADAKLLEMAKVFRLSYGNRFFYIYRPALKPFLYSGLKISLGMCWKSGVAAEVIGTPEHSIGERLYLSKVYLDTADLFAWTVVVVLLCVAFEKLVLWAVERFFAWEPNWQRNKKADKQGDQGLKGEKGAIVVQNLTKTYNGKVVLDHIAAEYQSGQTYYLTSPSGSGKTTLLRILAGVVPGDEGEVRGAGNGSMVFQEDRLCEEYDAVKNVELVVGDEELAREELLQLLPEEELWKPCGMLSGGQKRRVALVRALAADSDFLLLDEPFTGMDPETRQRSEEYIRSRQRGRTMIIATHI